MANIQDVIGGQLLKAAQVLEEQIDEKMKEIDAMDEDDLEAIRAKRMMELKKAQGKKLEMISNGHGKLEEVADQTEFFAATKKSDRVVCHFYSASNYKCKILDKHLDILARKYVGTRFIKINADRAVFLLERLRIQMIPTIAVIMNQNTVDYIRGFQDFDKDDFPTEALENRLARSQVINVEKRATAPAKKKIIRSGVDEYENEEDW